MSGQKKDMVCSPNGILFIMEKECSTCTLKHYSLNFGKVRLRETVQIKKTTYCMRVPCALETCMSDSQVILQDRKEMSGCQNVRTQGVQQGIH